MNTKICPFCGEVVSEKAVKCDSCGELLNLKCSYCGETVSENTIICPKCNTKIEKPKAKKSYTAGLLSVAFAIIYTFIALYLTFTIKYPMLAPDMAPIPNATANDKFGNVFGLLIFGLFPFISSIVAVNKKHCYSLAVFSFVLSIVITILCTLVIIC